MDIQRLWNDALDLWGTLDQHPMLHAALGLTVLLLISLIIGRLARFLGPRRAGRPGRRDDAPRTGAAATFPLGRSHGVLTPLEGA